MEYKRSQYNAVYELEREGPYAREENRIKARSSPRTPNKMSTGDKKKRQRTQLKYPTSSSSSCSRSPPFHHSTKKK
jgi:hypothetical protein